MEILLTFVVTISMKYLFKNMYRTYYLSSAQEITTAILEAIKANFKTKVIVITVKEEIDTTTYLMSSAVNKKMLKIY